jgi:hypothetical protein
MTIHPEPHDHKDNIAALLGTPPTICDRGFSHEVLELVQRRKRHRTRFVRGIWLFAVSGLVLALFGLGVDNSLMALLQQAAVLVSDLDLSMLASVENNVLSMLHNTGLLAIAATVLLAVVFAGTSLLD